MTYMQMVNSDLKILHAIATRGRCGLICKMTGKICLSLY